MVALVIIILLMNIAVAMVLPLWSTAIRREKEEELIFRGFQYAEAIRVFQNRHGRLPVKLEELVKVEPRSIRQLWKDPMTDSVDWGIVLSAGGKNTVSQGGGREQRNRRREKGNPGDSSIELGFPGSDSKDLPKGPIVGVFSRSTESSIKVFFDKKRYSDWKFTQSLVTSQSQSQKKSPDGQSSGHVGQRRGQSAQGPPRFGVKWLGRPFRRGLQPLQGNSGQGNRQGGRREPNGREPQNPGSESGDPGQSSSGKS